MYNELYKICKEVIENLRLKYKFRYSYDGHKFCIHETTKKKFKSLKQEYYKELNKKGLKGFLIVPLFWYWRKRY